MHFQQRNDSSKDLSVVSRTRQWRHIWDVALKLTKLSSPQHVECERREIEWNHLYHGPGPFVRLYRAAAAHAFVIKNELGTAKHRKTPTALIKDTHFGIGRKLICVCLMRKWMEIYTHARMIFAVLQSPEYIPIRIVLLRIDTYFTTAPARLFSPGSEPHLLHALQGSQW